MYLPNLPWQQRARSQSRLINGAQGAAPRHESDLNQPLQPPAAAAAHRNELKNKLIKLFTAIFPRRDFELPNGTP